MLYSTEKLPLRDQIFMQNEELGTTVFCPYSTSQLRKAIRTSDQSEEGVFEFDQFKE